MSAAPSVALVASVALGVLGATAHASPLSDALARHGDADIAALRARRDDVAARCTLGAIYARRNDLPRAALYLTDCEHAALPADIAAAVAHTARDVKHRLDASRFAALDVLSHPAGLVAEIDALPGESFTTPATLWIPAGPHVIRATRADRTWTRQVITEPHKNTLIVIETGLGARPPLPRPAAIDFAEEPAGALGDQHTGPPPDLEHPSLIGDKYRGVPAPPSGDALDDPLATRLAQAGPRRLWLGARLGAGLFDDAAAAAARAGIALGVAGRAPLTGAVFAAGRADWSRRGGDAITGTIDALGASAGLGATILGRGSGLALALIGQLRSDLRLTTTRGTAPVHRAGLGLAATAELALPATPFTAGVRYEQGLTDLVAGSRDRALLVELGIDLR